MYGPFSNFEKKDRPSQSPELLDAELLPFEPGQFQPSNQVEGPETAGGEGKVGSVGLGKR